MRARLFGAGLLAASTVLTGVQAHPDAERSVIVQGSSAARAVLLHGGTVTESLPIVDGVAARVPASALAAVAGTPGVRAVTPDERVTVASQSGDSDTEGPTRSVYQQSTGADAVHARGVTGRGVTVALVDTGIHPSPDVAGRIVRVDDANQATPLTSLSTSRRQLDCVDFSGTNSCDDAYGHGTFISGLIAGNGAQSAGGEYAGMAPQANLLSIKIAGRDGSADVSKVLAAIQWAVSFKDRYGIRVLNLSLGTNSRVPYRADPLNFAVERAWRAGIVVVVAAGNNGPAAGTISKPADDPLVITTGAENDHGTSPVRDDRVPLFSGRGPTHDGLAKPDLVAPGGRVISLRSPGSTIEQLAPGGGPDATYRRGSGTSMAAGVVSGGVALLLQAHPDWTPDRVKFALMATAGALDVTDPSIVGAGVLDVARAAQAPAGTANQGVTTLSDGSGSLDGSRGDVRVTDTCPGPAPCVDPNGNTTAQGAGFDAHQYTQGDWTGSSWYSSQWVSPTGSSWYGSSWYGSSWYGSSWYGETGTSSQSQATFFGVAVPGSAWYGAWG